MVYPKNTYNPEFNNAISYNNDYKRLEIEFKYAMHYNPRIKSLEVEKRRQSSFLLIINGEYRYRSKYIDITAKSGDLLFLPYNSGYKYEIVSKKTESMQVEFSIYFTNGATQISLCKHPFVIHNCHYLRDLFSDIVSTQNDKSISSSFKLMTNIYSLLSLAADNFDKNHCTPDYGKIAPAVNYIDNHYTEKVYVSSLAQMCNLSESQLRRLFYDMLKMSPIEYKNRLRINAAIKMLTAGYVSITEVADNLGFDNVYSFSQFFKHETGKAPSQYINK